MTDLVVEVFVKIPHSQGKKSCHQEKVILAPSLHCLATLRAIFKRGILAESTPPLSYEREEREWKAGDEKTQNGEANKREPKTREK